LTAEHVEIVLDRLKGAKIDEGAHVQLWKAAAYIVFIERHARHCFEVSDSRPSDFAPSYNAFIASTSSASGAFANFN